MITNLKLYLFTVRKKKSLKNRPSHGMTPLIKHIFYGFFFTVHTYIQSVLDIWNLMVKLHPPRVALKVFISTENL